MPPLGSSVCLPKSPSNPSGGGVRPTLALEHSCMSPVNRLHDPWTEGRREQEQFGLSPRTGAYGSLGRWESLAGGTAASLSGGSPRASIAASDLPKGQQ